MGDSRLGHAAIDNCAITWAGLVASNNLLVQPMRRMGRRDAGGRAALEQEDVGRRDGVGL